MRLIVAIPHNNPGLRLPCFYPSCALTELQVYQTCRLSGKLRFFPILLAVALGKRSTCFSVARLTIMLTLSSFHGSSNDRRAGFLGLGSTPAPSPDQRSMSV